MSHSANVYISTTLKSGQNGCSNGCQWSSTLDHPTYVCLLKDGDIHYRPIISMHPITHPHGWMVYCVILVMETSL